MTTKAWAEKVQLKSLQTAERYGQGYTSADIELVIACDDVPVAELAETLGRSYYAIQALRQAIALGLPVGSDRDVAPVQQARVYTYINGDEPE